MTCSSRPALVGLCSVSVLVCVRCWSLLVCSGPPVFLFEEFHRTEVTILLGSYKLRAVYLGAELVPSCVFNGRSSSFQPSLKGSRARQTASIRVGELSIRYMRPFRTSLTDIYSYGTTVHMSILSRRFVCRVQIMPTSRLARATGSRCNHAHPIGSCRLR